MSNKHIHILGMCGTFMGGVALLARAMGWRVTGMDQNVYPPMSVQLATQGIDLIEGYSIEHMPRHADAYVIGNALSRGNVCIEYILEHKLPYVSGPEFLYRSVLSSRTVLAVAGTHGKTTTSSLLAWILACSGEDVGFLVGGVPNNFGVSSHLGASRYFVVEADEYDTAFFDKRSKFVHYHPDSLILNNLEYDHADIFDSVEDIKKQFHHLLRTVPANGQVLMSADEPHLDAVVAMGCWTPVQRFGLQGSDGWQARLLDESGCRYEVSFQGELRGEVCATLMGKHNVKNALAAIAVACHHGVPVEAAIAAVSSFQGVKRRMEILYADDAVTLYDDFAHHPTAIKATLQGLRGLIGRQTLTVCMEPRSNSLRQGVHQQALQQAFDDADAVFFLQPAGVAANMQQVAAAMGGKARVCDTVHVMVDAVKPVAGQPMHVVIMSNGDFSGLREQLINKLRSEVE